MPGSARDLILPGLGTPSASLEFTAAGTGGTIAGSDGPPDDTVTIMRRLAMALGLIAVAVGGWTLHHVRSQQATCVPHTAGSAGFGVSTSCLNQVGAEYISLGVIVVGIFVFLGALLLLNRERMTRRATADLEHRLVGTPGQTAKTDERFAKYDGRGGTASASHRGVTTLR